MSFLKDTNDLPFLRKQLERFFYWKICFSRSNSYYGTFTGLLEQYLILSLWLSVTFGFKNQLLLLAGGFILVVIASIVGHIDIQKGIAKLEVGVSNRLNPHLMEIHENSERLKNMELKINEIRETINNMEWEKKKSN